MAELNYTCHGEGLPVVCIHGFQADHNLMEECLEPIFRQRKGYQRLYVDMPGMGLSRAPLEYATADNVLSTLLEFIDQHVSGPFLLAGQSYGGYMAQGILHRKWEKIKGMLLMVPVVDPDRNKRTIDLAHYQKRDERFLETLGEKDRLAFEEDMVVCDRERYLRYHQVITEAFGRDDPPFIEKLCKNYAFSFNPNAECDVPVLLLTGRQDTCVGWKDQQKLIPLYHRSSFVTMDEAGHNLQLDQPKLFEVLVGFWLDRIEQGGL
jgi:pimeloyl-ACP methyl ester carboxylesterase